MAEITSISGGRRLPQKAIAPALLAHTLGGLLEAERYFREHSQEITRCQMPTFRCPDDYVTVDARSAARQELLTRIESLIEGWPKPELIERAIRLLEESLRVPADRRIIRLAVALLLDSKSKAPSNPEVYFESMVYDLIDLEFPSAVVVSACERVRRALTFLPETAEIVATCRQVHDLYLRNLEIAKRALSGLRSLERWVLDLRRSQNTATS